MNTKPGPSKRRSSSTTPRVSAKKRKQESSVDIRDCSSKEAVFSQYQDNELSDGKGTDDRSDCSTFGLNICSQQQPSTHRGLPQVVQRLSYPEDERTISHDVPATPSVSLLRSDAPTRELFTSDVNTSPIPPSATRSGVANNSPTMTTTINVNDIPSQQGATSDWSSDRSTMRMIDFKKLQKLLVPVPSDPFEAFRLFLNDDMLDLIVQETNLNAVRVLHGTNVSRKSRINSWKVLTRDELMTFLGLLLHTGTIRLNRLNDYWKKHWLFSIPCFGQFMSRNRFMLILRCLHFSSESTAEHQLAKIRPIIDHFNRKMQEIYYPGKQLSLDESMVVWRGRLIFQQYIKNKRHKFGIKLYVLAEPEGTALKFHICTGAGNSTSGEEHTEKIVLKLLEEKLDTGHSVYMGDYYNSYGLAVKLLNRDTYCTGTLDNNRKGNPTDLATVTLQKGENKSLFLNGVHIGKWRDKRYVLYLSTEHDDAMMEVTSKKGEVTIKPSAIVHYKNFMSGVDLQDQMQSYYPCERKTMRWYKKIFIHTMQTALINSFHLYNKFTVTKKINLYDFRLFILEKMLPNPNLVKTLQKQTVTNEHNLTKIETVRNREKKEGCKTRIIKEIVRKECKGCRAKQKRVATIYECKSCDGSPGYCTVCFCEAHVL